jgi:hypothetical protein
MLPGESLLRYLQVRVHQGRLLHQLHLGRQGLLRDSAIVLRLLGDLLQERLLLLHLLQQHAGLLRHLLIAVAGLAVAGLSEAGRIVPRPLRGRQIDRVTEMRVSGLTAGDALYFLVHLET